MRKKKPIPLPLRAQICIMQRDALLRRSAPPKAPMPRAHILAMIWEHRAMDILYRDPTENCDWPLDDSDADEAIPF